MGLLDSAEQARQPPTPDTDDDSGDGDEPPQRNDRPSTGGTANVGQSFSTTIRGQTVDIDGDELTLERPETKQPDENTGNWLTSGDSYGVPRGIKAAKHRNIVQTAAMQSIVNGISDQLLGGDLVFLDNDDVMEDLSDAELMQVERLKLIFRDVLTGPHMGDEDLDDIVTACVEDMLGPGNAYIQPLAPQSGALPVAALSTLDPLTIRHNVDEHGYPQDPPYWQATGFGSSGVTSMLDDPTPMDDEDLIVLRYPKGERSYKRYPTSAVWQIREFLELLADETTHIKRFYSDDMASPGMMQIVNATDSTIDDIQNQLEQAAQDPRDFPVVGGESPAQWVEMGGKAVNLDVISEQQWFYQMCLGALGLNKAEVGMVEDVNYSNGEVQSEIVYKRVAGPFGKQFERAFMEIARQFDLFRELGEPFTITLAYTDPKAEHAKQDRLRQQFEAGVITLRQYHRRVGNEDLAEDPEQYTVTVGGETVDYGAHPWPVAKRLLSAAGATDPDDADLPPQGESETDGESTPEGAE